MLYLWSHVIYICAVWACRPITYLNPLGDPNVNYNILAHALSEAKQKHIPRKVKRFNKRKHFKHKWMTNDLLTLINKKNDRYRGWKSTTDNILYEIKKINF